MKIMELNTKEYEELVKKGLAEEEKKMPEKLDMVLLGQCDNWLQPTIETDEKIRAELNPYVIDIIRENTLEIQHKFNELLDYLKSKGE